MPQITIPMMRRLLAMYENDTPDGYAVMNEDPVTKGLKSRGLIEGHTAHYTLTDAGFRWVVACYFQEKCERQLTDKLIDCVLHIVRCVPTNYTRPFPTRDVLNKAIHAFVETGVGAPLSLAKFDKDPRSSAHYNIGNVKKPSASAAYPISA